MKYIFIAISLLFTLTPVYSQMEFEEVLSTAQFGEGNHVYGIDIMKDSTLLSVDIKGIENNIKYFLMSNETYELNEITDIITKNFGNTKLGLFHPKLSQFVRYEESDTTIYYIDLNGDIVKKIKYPHNNLDFGQLIINSNDESFLGIYHEYEQSLTDTYYHDIVYTTNYGKTWHQINPEQFIYEETGTLFNTHRAIDAFFSSKNNGKMLLRFNWSSKFEDHFEYTTYDYYSQEFKMYNNWFNPEEVLCFECHLEDYITVNKGLSPVLTLKDNSSNLDLINYYDLVKLNQDSLNSIDEFIHLFSATRINRRNYLINMTNYNHHIMMIYHNSKTSEINKFYFQSFDSGKTWEKLFNDTNSNYINLTRINHFTNDLWVSKRIEDDEKYGFDYFKIYISKSPLTNIERENRELGLSVLFDHNGLNIKSDNEYYNSQINLYDLEGRILFNKALSLTKGNNYLQIPGLQNKLILVAIKTKNGDEVFKLLNTN